LNPNHTVLESARDMPDPASEEIARTVLGSFLFRGDDVFKGTAVLSGGEKTRLALVRLLLDPPNLLLMDEPTTHLDVGSIDALLGALTQYKGTLVFISHDVYFIRAVAKAVLHISGGKLTPYAGDYEYYLEKSRATSAQLALTSGEKLQDVATESDGGRVSRKPGLRDVREQRRVEAEEKKANAKVRRTHEKKVWELEQAIAKLESRKGELTAELAKPETYEQGSPVMELNRELQSVINDLEKVTADWMELIESGVASTGGINAALRKSIS